MLAFTKQRGGNRHLRHGDLGLCGFLHSEPAVVCIASIGLCARHAALVAVIHAEATPAKGRDVRSSKRLTLVSRV